MDEELEKKKVNKKTRNAIHVRHPWGFIVGCWGVVGRPLQNKLKPLCLLIAWELAHDSQGVS